MKRSVAEARAGANHLLASFPASVLSALDVQRDDCTAHSVLITPAEQPEWIFFPERGCVVCAVRSTESGMTVEVGLVGVEGLVGAEHLLSPAVTGSQAIVQIGGRVSRIRLPDIRKAMADSSTRDVLLEYCGRFLAQVAQNSVCNRLHSAEQRLAKWLLQVHERAESNELELTHDFLAQMLGMRRAGTTITAGVLQVAGIIRQERGCITILDVPSLAARVCECYAQSRGGAGAVST